jgi:hypothetical protein
VKQLRLRGRGDGGGRGLGRRHCRYMEGHLDELYEFLLKTFVHSIWEHKEYIMIKTVNRKLTYKELKVLKKNMMIRTPMHTELWIQEL